MSALESIQDDWLGEDAADLLGALDEVFAELAGTALDVGQVVLGADALGKLGILQEQGWYEFATDEGTDTSLYAETVKRLHRRQIPVPAPVFEAFAALRLLQSVTDPAAQRLLAAVQSGERHLVLDLASLFSPRAVGTSGGAVPFGGTVSSLVVVSDGGALALHVVDPAGSATADAPLIDPTMPAVMLEDTGEALAALPQAVWESAVGEVLVAQANALVGQAQAMFESTLAFLAVREQFGVPIGSFQALRHRASDVASELYAAHQLSVHIAEAFGAGRDQKQLGLLGKSLCGRAAVMASSEAVQLRGGMGFTWEDGTHFGLKRIMSLAMTGPSIEDAERELGAGIIDSGRPRWAGGLDNA